MNAAVAMPYKSFVKFKSFLSTEFLTCSPISVYHNNLKRGKPTSPSRKDYSAEMGLRPIIYTLLRVNFHCLLIHWLSESVNSHFKK